jgi:hypothetical protein
MHASRPAVGVEQPSRRPCETSQSNDSPGMPGAIDMSGFTSAPLRPSSISVSRLLTPRGPASMTASRRSNMLDASFALHSSGGLMRTTGNALLEAIKRYRCCGYPGTTRHGNVEAASRGKVGFTCARGSGAGVDLVRPRFIQSTSADCQVRMPLK